MSETRPGVATDDWGCRIACPVCASRGDLSKPGMRAGHGQLVTVPLFVPGHEWPSQSCPPPRADLHRKQTFTESCRHTAVSRDEDEQAAKAPCFTLRLRAFQERRFQVGTLSCSSDLTLVRSQLVTAQDLSIA